MLLEELKQCVGNWKSRLKNDIDALLPLLTPVDSPPEKALKEHALKEHDLYQLVQNDCIPMKIFGTKLWFGVATRSERFTRAILREHYGVDKKIRGPDKKFIRNPEYDEVTAMKTYSNVATQDGNPAFQFEKGDKFFTFVRDYEGKGVKYFYRGTTSERFQLMVEEIGEDKLAFRLEKLEEKLLEEVDVPSKPETYIKWKDIVGALLVLMSQSNVKYVYTHPVVPQNKKREELNQILHDLFGPPTYLREAREKETSRKFWDKYENEDDVRPMVLASDVQVSASNANDNRGWYPGEKDDSHPIYRLWKFDPDYKGMEGFNKKQRVAGQAGPSS